MWFIFLFSSIRNYASLISQQLYLLSMKHALFQSQTGSLRATIWSADLDE